MYKIENLKIGQILEFPSFPIGSVDKFIVTGFFAIRDGLCPGSTRERNFFWSNDPALSNRVELQHAGEGRTPPFDVEHAYYLSNEDLERWSQPFTQEMVEEAQRCYESLSQAAQRLGSARSEKKTAAARENAKRAGRPKTSPLTRREQQRESARKRRAKNKRLTPKP